MRNWGGIERIPKHQFYSLGGFSNPDLFRKAPTNGAWQYFVDRRH